MNGLMDELLDGIKNRCLAEGRGYHIDALKKENAELRAALDDIANGRLGVTDAMLQSREAMMSALADYCQQRARAALAKAPDREAA